MNNYANIIKAALESAGTGAKKVGQGAVNFAKDHPAIAAGGVALPAGGAIVENSLQAAMEDLRRQGYTDEQIINYLLSYDTNALQGE